MMVRHETPRDGTNVPGVGPVRVFLEAHKIVTGSPFDFTRENIDQYQF